MSDMILPPGSTIYRLFRQIVSQQRIAFLVGLPGTGKSLLLQQLALMAHRAGRTVHLLQYDVARLAFETAANLTKYPEIDGFTHAVIRKAVGLWARVGLVQWQHQYAEAAHFLLGEVPLVGNRLVELAQPHEDEAEVLLTSDETVFLLPVPSIEVRRVIESAREQSIAQPRHEKEAKDAPPNVLHALWQEVAQVGFQLGLTETKPAGEVAYDAGVYTAVYQHLLQHRHHHIFPLDTILKPGGSAYDLTITGSELAASPAEVEQIITTIEQIYTPETLEYAVSHWFER